MSRHALQTVDESTIEIISVQLFSKKFRVRDAVERRWKIVPGERTGVREGTLADLSATARLNVLSGVGGSQTGPRVVDGDGTHHVGRIRRTLTGGN